MRLQQHQHLHRHRGVVSRQLHDAGNRRRTSKGQDDLLRMLKHWKQKKERLLAIRSHGIGECKIANAMKRNDEIKNFACEINTYKITSSHLL